MNTVPCVIFGFNRPRTLKRVIRALSTQGIDKIIIFIDGPRNNYDIELVENSRKISEAVDWAEKELYFWDENKGLERLHENINQVMMEYPQAVFVEDDCLPMPGFYQFMTKALDIYQADQSVFSIGGYQPIHSRYFRKNPFRVVSSARFTCWGWATWANQWKEAYPHILRFKTLFNNLQDVPDIAGTDVPIMARIASNGEDESWDIKVTIASLWLGKTHLLATHGLVRNIGLTLSGMHRGLRSLPRNWWIQNRNVTKRTPTQKTWLVNTQLNLEYATKYKEFIFNLRKFGVRWWWNRTKLLAQRYLLPTQERYFNLNITGIKECQQKKHALLSYIAHPVSIPRDDQRFYRHINIWHAKEIVRVLNRMGYLVDLIDYRDDKFIPNKSYDLFIGHGGINFTHISKKLPESTPRIYFSTGSYWNFHNKQEEIRFLDLHQRRGVSLPYDRYIKQDEETALRSADGILGIGNQHTRQTYTNFQNVRMVNGTSLQDASFDWYKKDYESGRNHFVFFSGRGNIHKGLDLVLEAFSDLDHNLWICTQLEKDFSLVYEKELKLPNIHVVGWTQPRSLKFYQIMHTCNFCILPSCSEGQSQAVVECMNQGVIPIVSRETGLDVDKYGFFIEHSTPTEIRTIVQEKATLTAELCNELSNQARFAATKYFSEQQFTKNLRSALEAFLT